MTHPITPPPELVQQLREQAPRYRDGGVGREVWLINRAYSAGAAQELEECCEVADCAGWATSAGNDLRAARRPKPPSLKERALEDLASIEANCGHLTRPEMLLQSKRVSTIRRALEALPNDQH
jgi:hypothetical protein